MRAALENEHEASDTVATADPAARVLERTRRCWCTAGDELLPLDCAIGVGIGYAAVTREGSPVYERGYGLS